MESQQQYISSDEETTEDFDSTLGSETSSISQSLSTSVMAYEYEHGRRYHAYEAGKYNIPNDEDESSRLDLQHRIWLLTLKDQLYRAPIVETQIKTVLDVGTGTGIWAVDFADKHPNCHVIGTDLSPIQPTSVPPNCEFIVDDADADRVWDFGKKFDFIHSRLLVAGIKNWPRYLNKCFESLASGGWIELLETEFPMTCPDGSVTNDDPLMVWSDLLAKAGTEAGCDFQVQDKLQGYLQETGFTKITRENYTWPIGPWEKDEHLALIGSFMIPNILEGIKTVRAFFTRKLGWSVEEFEVFLIQCRAAIKDQTKHRYVKLSVHYAQKPIGTPSLEA